MSISSSQGSVETLFRWGGKHLRHFAADLFRKRCTKLHQNRPSFIGDITTNILVSFLCTQCILIPLSDYIETQFLYYTHETKNYRHMIISPLFTLVLTFPPRFCPWTLPGTLTPDLQFGCRYWISRCLGMGVYLWRGRGGMCPISVIVPAVLTDWCFVH